MTYPKSTGDELPAVDWNIVAAQADAALKPTGNLAGLSDNAAARTNIGLGNSATRNVGTTAGTVAEGDALTAAQADATQALADAATAQAAADAAQATADATEAIVDEAVSLRDDATEPAWGVVDQYGSVALGVNNAGEVLIPGGTLGKAPAGYAYALSDAHGEVVGYVDLDGVGHGVFEQIEPAAEVTTYSDAEMAQRNARALGLSAAVATETNTTAARPVWTYNHVLAYGQSLSTGWEGWPRLSATQPFDNLMLGDSDHPTSESSTTWTQFGTAAFNPLVATVEKAGALADPATVASYTAGDTARGETPVVGAVNFWRKQQLAFRGLLSDSTRRLVASSCGVGGRSIESLSKGAGTEIFNRLRGAANIAKTLATAASGTYGVAAVMWLQGENNSAEVSGTNDKDTYKALCVTLQQDITGDIATTIAAQDAPPAIFTYQIGGTYVRDTNNLSIPQAQLECAQEMRDWYLAAPAYPVTDKGGHLDPNGYRWLGMQFGKVMHQVLDLGRGWMPVHPLRATWRGRQVLIDFHVPHPPLQFQAGYVVLAATTYAAKGFKVTDDTGALTISTVEIVNDACVLITLSSDIGDNPYLWYGDKTVHNGNGNLCDSDPTTASDLYEYTSGTGQYAGAEIAALEDEPYPLWNWCVIFRIAITADPAS